jgi:cyanuric acid amidohydrolase
MSPHATIFTRSPDRGAPSGRKRLAVGTAYTREVLPEEFGRMEHVRVAADGVRTAIEDAASRTRPTFISSKSRPAP